MAEGRERRARGGARGRAKAAGAIAVTVALACVTLTLVAPPSAAGDVPLELRGRPVAVVRVEGEAAHVLGPREIGVPVGAPLTRRLVRRIIERLVATGRFADVRIDAVATAGGVELIARLSPRIVLLRVDIYGNEVLSEDDAQRALALPTGRAVDDEVLANAGRSLEAAYREIGFDHTSIELELRETDDPTRRVLVVHVEEGQPTRLGTIRFTDADRPDLLAGALGIERGERLGRRMLGERAREAAQSLRARGYLEAQFGPAEWRPHPNGVVDVAMPGHAGPRYRLAIRGQGPVSRGALRDTLALERDPLGPPAVLDAMEQRVVDLYRRHGFDRARAAVRTLAGRTPNDAVLALDIRHGPPLEIVSIELPGAHALDSDFLRGEIESYLEEELPSSTLVRPVDADTVDRLGFSGGDDRSRRTVPRPHDLPARRVFYEPIYDEALEHLREVYEARGYLDARLGPLALTRLSTTRGIVTIPVEEGPRTTIEYVRISGHRALSTRTLLEAAGLSPGDPLSHVALEEARLRIVDAFREAGHLYATAEPTTTVSRDRTHATVEFRVAESFPVHVDDVVIRGAIHTSETIIRDRLALVPGELYRPSLARETQERLLELGVFGSVIVAPSDPDLPAREKTVVVTLTERKNQLLDGRFGISSGEGARGGFEYGYRNLFGHAVGLNLRVSLAYQFFFVQQVVEDRYDRLDLVERLERDVIAGITFPYVPSLPGARVSLDASHTRNNERDFGLDRNALAATFAYRFGKRTNVALRQGLEDNNVGLFVDESYEDFLENTTDPRLRNLLRVPQGRSTLVTTTVSASYDHRDSAFSASRGYFLSASLEWARTLSTELVDIANLAQRFVSHHLRASVTASGYLPLAERLVLAGQLRLGRVFHLDDRSQTYPNRRFFLGGADTVRGHPQDALVPQDLARLIESDPELDPNAVLRGGDLFVLARVELRFPIAGVVRGGLFADLGNLWADATQVTFGDMFDLRPTAGLGLRIDTPVFPLAFDYGINVLRRRYLREPFGWFHFSIGLF